MAVVQLQMDEESQQSASLLALFPMTSKVPDNDLFALITDFFDWLEKDWRLPVYTPGAEQPPLPHPITLTESPYTKQDLATLFGRAPHTILQFLWTHGVAPFEHRRINKVGQPQALYRKQDLAAVVDRWERERLIRAIDQWWIRFFPPACGTCQRCRTHARYPVAQQIYCSHSAPQYHLRSVFAHFVEQLRHLGSVSAWWQAHHMETQREARQGGWGTAWGTVFIYLLDRRLLHLSNDELVHLEPLHRRRYQNLFRLWRHRHPEEYEQFRYALECANYNPWTRDIALALLSFLVLLKHGLSSIAQLARAPSPEEIQHLCREGRLVTPSLGFGVFLPYPLSADIRVGHVALDDIRYYFWCCAADREQPKRQQCWDKGPRNWRQMMVGAIEQALAAPVYEGTKSILSRRPETEGKLINPQRFAYEGRLTDSGYALLPRVVQEALMTYFVHLHQEVHTALTTLRTRVQALLHFFTWVRRQGMVTQYPHWTREFAQELFRAYASLGCAELQAMTRRERLQQVAHFFSTLADLEIPVPSGYQLLYTLEKGAESPPRHLPQEEIMDRVFQDGVRRLSYDPFSRLALTIQYYCGTRVTETCELHLFSILEDQQGHAYLLIPRGKSKLERPFPIVEVGMGPLLEYMDEIVAARLTPEGTSRLLGKTNFRYLEDDPERARDWHYLFDRVSGPDEARRRGRLSRARVSGALSEALLIAAKINPQGLFQQSTYRTTCQYRREKGLECRYLAAEVGITICPCCGSPLSGKLGAYCHHLLEEELVCDGRAENGEAFCPKCDQPLATFLPITTHIFRHNSVSRAHRAGVSLAQNMQLHGHKTMPMHLRYLHLLLEDTTNEVRQIFAEKRLRDVRQLLGSAAGKIVEGGIAYTVSLEQYLGLTLQRALKRRTYGIWGGFWAGALAQRGIASPLSIENEIVIPEDTYEHTVAQYWYEALGLAVSEVAFEYVTAGKWRAEVPSFLDRQKIESLVQFHLHHVQDSFKSALGQRLMETDILEQRRFLDDLAEKLLPWWQHLGSIDQLVEMFAPGGGHAFQKQLSSTEPEA